MSSLGSFTGTTKIKKQASKLFYLDLSNKSLYYVYPSIHALSWLLIGLSLCFIISYRENLFEEMLREPEEIASKRKRTRDTLRVLQQAFRVGFPDFVIHIVALHRALITSIYQLLYICYQTCWHVVTHILGFFLSFSTLNASTAL